MNPQAIAILGGTGDQGLGLALRFARAGRLVGAVALNQPPKLIRLRMLIGKRGGLEEALKLAES